MKESTDMSIDTIFALPYSNEKRKIIDNNLSKLLNIYSDALGIPYVIVNSENKYTVLKNVSMNKTASQVEYQMRTVFGKRVMIRATYADKLLSAIVDSKPEKEQYKYIHAIGPYILDPWNCTYSHGVFRCYYKDGNELTECPLTTKKIFTIWNNSVEGGGRYYSDCFI
jgi:ribosomal protein S10